MTALAPRTVDLDHERYTKHRTYRRKVNAAIRRLVAEHPDGLSRMTVLHEFDDSCCRREPWLITYVSLIQALNADGLRTLGVWLSGHDQPDNQQVAPATATGARAPRRRL